jgi:hypothetical protein
LGVYFRGKKVYTVNIIKLVLQERTMRNVPKAVIEQIQEDFDRESALLQDRFDYTKFCEWVQYAYFTHWEQTSSFMHTRKIDKGWDIDAVKDFVASI